MGDPLCLQTMTGAGKKPYHHGDLRESLLTAAEAALADMRLEDVSLREIARRAGVSHAAPKHHFATLGQLFGEVAARGFERFVEALGTAADAAPDQSPAARLRAMGRAYVGFAAENSAVYGLMFGRHMSVEPTPHLATAMYAAWDQLARQVADVTGPERALHGAIYVWSCVHGMAMLRLDSKMPPHIDPVAAVDAATRYLIAGLQADTA